MIASILLCLTLSMVAGPELRNGYLIQIEWSSKIYTTDFTPRYLFLPEEEWKDFLVDTIGDEPEVYLGLLNNGAINVEIGASDQEIAGCCELEVLASWYKLLDRRSDDLPAVYKGRASNVSSQLADSVIDKRVVEYSRSRYVYNIVGVTAEMCLCNPYPEVVSGDRYYACISEIRSVRRLNKPEMDKFLRVFDEIVLNANID